MGFLVGIEVDDCKGGGGGKGEDERLEPTMVMRFVSRAMVRKDGVLTKEGNERGCEERDVVGGGGLGAEGGMLGGGRVGQSRVGLLESDDIGTGV